MAGPITTYNALVSAVVEAMEDDSSEFLAYIPAAIDLAERRIEKEIDTDGMVSVVATTLPAGQHILPKPSGYRFFRDVEAVVSGNYIGLKKKVNSFLRDYWPNPTETTTTPLYYADYDENNIMIAPTPSGNTQIRLTTAIRPTRLSAGNQTNYFLREVPDAVFYATMANMSEFMKAFQSQQVWENKYVNSMMGVNNEGRRQRMDDDTDPNLAPSSNNTLKKGEG